MKNIFLFALLLSLYSPKSQANAAVVTVIGGGIASFVIYNQDTLQDNAISATIDLSKYLSGNGTLNVSDLHNDAVDFLAGEKPSKRFEKVLRDLQNTDALSKYTKEELAVMILESK